MRRRDDQAGDNNFLMAYVHIAHDCKIGNNVVIANSAGLAGHVAVEDYAVIGGIVGVHQFTRIGAYAWLALQRHRAGYTSVHNGVRAKGKTLRPQFSGLKRNGFPDSTINELKKAYKILFREKTYIKGSA